MPAYATRTAVPLLENGQVIVIAPTETVSSSFISQAVQLQRRQSPYHYPWGVSIEVAFASDPGTVSISVQTSDTDGVNNYVTLTTLTQAGLNSSFVGRVELTAFWCKFMRLQFTALTNVVATTAQFTR